MSFAIWLMLAIILIGGAMATIIIVRTTGKNAEKKPTITDQSRS